MRFCVKCGQRLTDDDIRCPACRMSLRPVESPGSVTSATPRTSGHPSPRSASPSLSGLADRSSRNQSNTHFGHGAISADLRSIDDGNCDTGAETTESRSEPVPVVTVLGVPILRQSHPSPVPESRFTPIEIGVTIPLASGSQRNWDVVSSRAPGKSPSAEGQSNDKPAKASPVPTVELVRQSRTRPQHGLRADLGRSETWIAPFGAMDWRPIPSQAGTAPNETDDLAARNIVVEATAIPKQLGPAHLAKSGPEPTVDAGRSVNPSTDVESLFYTLDSQVFGLPPPSVRSRPTSSAPPASRRSSRSMKRARSSSRWWVVSTAVALSLGAAGYLYYKRAHSQPAFPTPPAPLRLPGSINSALNSGQ